MNITTEDARKEIAKCLDMSRDGIHAMLMVFSAATRFTPEDADTVKSIKMFFGDKIVDHMILVSTYGDQVGEMNWRKMLSNKNVRYLQVNFFLASLISPLHFLSQGLIPSVPNLYMFLTQIIYR